MYIILTAFLITLVYLSGTQINYFLFIKRNYKNFLKEGLTKEESYTEAKLNVEGKLHYVMLIYLSWLVTIPLLIYKMFYLYNDFINKKIKQIITK